MIEPMGSERVVLVGHPFAPIGMGEHLRSTFRALRAVKATVQIMDIYKAAHRDSRLAEELTPFLTDDLNNAITVFCVNGDEIDGVRSRLGDWDKSLRRIIYPAWELAQYPAVWARRLEQFDEVWAASAFTHDSISRSVSVPVYHMPLATQPLVHEPLGRRAFGIPEDCYAFLFFFDLTSFIERKNPFAALEAYRRVRELRPERNFRFVVKLNSSGARPQDRQRFLDFVRPFDDSVVVLDRTMTDCEVKALHRCCDAFVSLHRCEGYGFGLAEAMFLGKPVIGTGYSGNLDFMNKETSFLIDYHLVPISDGAYPQASGQVWAEPNVEQAAEIMVRLGDNSALGLAIGCAASRRMRVYFSHRACGLHYAARLASYRDNERRVV